jgi:hypothetical protein
MASRVRHFAALGDMKNLAEDWPDVETEDRERSLRLLLSNAAIVLQVPAGAVQFEQVSAKKGDSGLCAYDRSQFCFYFVQ